MSDDAVRSILGNGLRAMRPVLATAVLFGFFINLLLFVSPLYMLQIYDRVLPSRNETTLAGITLIAAFGLAVYAALEMLRSRLLVRGGMIFDQQIANQIFDAAHRGTLLRPGAQHETALRDVDILREFLTGSGILAFCDLPWTPIFLVACFALHPWFGWMAFVGGGTILALTLLNEVATRRPLQSANQVSRVAGQQAGATFRNGEVLQAMGMLAAMRTLWRSRHDEVLRLQARASDRAGIIIAATKFIRLLLQMLVLGAGAYLAIHREITAGSMIAASIIIGRALTPIEGVVGNWKSFTGARASYRRLAALLAVAGPEPRRLALPRPRGFIEATALSVAAPGASRPILSEVAFTFEAGSVVGIIGPSAAGKSTLVRAITGLWPLLAGSVRIDGSDLRHWDQQELGRHVGYLPQDVELFEGTVAQNIARFDAGDDAAILAVAQRAGCHELIQALPDGYNTVIGQGGHGLSGGQRQRIALARAMYGDPSLIVLDEPNASLDQSGEVALMRAVADLKAAGTTIVIVTHKLSLLTNADRVLVLNGGTVQTFGPAEQVLGQIAGPRAVPTRVPASGSAALPEPCRALDAQRNAG
ncbi:MULTISPECIES: type I secretion system permease/ATPase [unclassified Methylobacterium]|uniref:type I secretion system permease/ATPase n=1 Tax=unclassified Methylobacterium TaxID=2615210 RepID=UPI0006F67F1A|nr:MULTISPECIES: type I secretion system permease/ATPase [unclassified Methylobacterium]KQP89787.1 type I secretion system ABC transporter ATP-binding protein [Methylobacterium sp. Leaf113]KQP94633.1 type I secretion system ABC transporter ATP-binding protein [Methylobacterium sp. Leaf117]MCK2056383.1 type I secretion system permease/ATPase [Methylobacterium sp. 37f]